MFYLIKKQFYHTLRNRKTTMLVDKNKVTDSLLFINMLNADSWYPIHEKKNNLIFTSWR